MTTIQGGMDMHSWSIYRLLLVFASVTLLFCSRAQAQETPEFYIGPNGEKVYTKADKVPEYPGGSEALLKYIRDTMKYPSEAKEARVQGRVMASFIVNRQGDVTSIEIVEGLGSGTDEEVIRVLENMPRWTPGEAGGKPVSVKFTMPFHFALK